MAPSQTFQDHIHEFRRRLFVVACTIGISASLAYVFRDQAIAAIQKPLNEPLFYSAPGGGFDFVLKLSVVIGMFITLPVLIFQLVRFIEPALPRRLKISAIFKVMATSTFLALAGMAFAYFILIPQTLHFFSSFSNGSVKALISADSYLSFVINNLITFALAFQIPLLVLFINWIRPIKPGKLLKYQRHVIVGAFGLAVILPFTYEPIQQFIIAVPIIVLYYLSVILLAITNREGRRVKKAVPETIPTFEVRKPLLAPIPVEIEPVLAPMPVLAAAPTMSRISRLSLDGFIPTANAQAQVAATKVTAAPTISQPVVNRRPPSFSTDGFLRQPHPLPN